MTDDEIRALAEGNPPRGDADFAEVIQALANAALEARAERDKLQGELIGVLSRETASLVRWEDKLEASQAELAAARAELATVKAERDAMRTTLDRAGRALRPFANCVFNDNGDYTVSDQHRLTYVDFANAYQASGRIAALQSTPTQKERSDV